MKRRLEATPSPAFVISLIALFVALGGTAYAATSLPKNSVGTAQLKNGAVTRGKIAKKTVVALKGNRGPRGLQGLQGIQGIQGAQGVKGDTGPRGPSDAYNKTGTFALSNLPAGSYLIIGKLGFSGGTGTASLVCDLDAVPTAGGTVSTLDHAQASANTSTGTTDLVVPLEALATFAAPQNLILSCSASSGGSASFANPELTATQVGAIH